MVFFFDNDFVMRSCLVLTDSPVLFKVGNFKQENIRKIKDEWANITKAIDITVNLLVEFGFSGETITSQNAIIPLAYYIIKSGQINSETKNEIKHFLIHSFLKQVYGGQGDRVLSNIRDELREKDITGTYKLKNCKFSFNDFLDMRIPGNKSFQISEEDLEEMLDYKKGPYTFMVQTLLYPHLKYGQIKFHQDHLHPDGFFNKTGFKQNGVAEDNWEKYKDLKDRLPNLQLLEGGENESKNKTSLINWINNKEVISDLKKYKNDSFIPNDVSLEFKDFEDFYNRRRKIIKDRLKNILLITETLSEENMDNTQSS